MKRLLFATVLVALMAAGPAAAIVFGEPDAGRHPNVGAMMIQTEIDGEDELFPFCSGTLVSDRVFLTAAHCFFFADLLFGAAGYDVFVTFADDLATMNPATDLIPGTGHAHPSFRPIGRTPGNVDVGVIVLEESPDDIDPASLPDEGQVDQLDLRREWFTTVGYGAVREKKQLGPHTLFADTIRRVATQGALARNAAWLLLPMNPSTGNGGTCFGDSGGPHFLRDTDTVMSVTSTGDRWCRAADWTARVDTADALDFVNGFIED